MGKRFAYIEITEWLRGEVERVGPGALLPTVAELCERFDVSGVQTVRNAYAPLIEEGLVERLGSPRRWAVVDHGQEAAPAPDAREKLERLEALLAEAAELARDLRLAA